RRACRHRISSVRPCLSYSNGGVRTPLDLLGKQESALGQQPAPIAKSVARFQSIDVSCTPPGSPSQLHRTIIPRWPPRLFACARLLSGHRWAYPVAILHSTDFSCRVSKVSNCVEPPPDVVI